SLIALTFPWPGFTPKVGSSIMAPACQRVGRDQPEPPMTLLPIPTRSPMLFMPSTLELEHGSKRPCGATLPPPALQSAPAIDVAVALQLNASVPPMKPAALIAMA